MECGANFGRPKKWTSAKVSRTNKLALDMEPDLQLNDIPEVVITESVKVAKMAVEPPKVGTDAPKGTSLERETTPVEILPLDGDPGEVVDEKVEAKIAEQLKTFRESPPVSIPPIGVSGSSPAIFQYHQGGLRKPINLEFQEFEDPASWIYLKLRAADKSTKEKVSELAKIIQNKWGSAVQVNSVRQRNKGFTAHLYFLKYSHLERRDVLALKKLQDVAMKKGICFLFVDEEFKNMSRVTKKLQDQALLPPGVILLPWLQDFTDDQLKAIVGLTVSAKFEDMTKSMRTINRVLIPPLRDSRSKK